MKSEVNQPVRVLFVNTRSALGADVAVHLTLIKSFGGECQTTLATNSKSVDLERTLDQLKSVPNLRIDVINLGYEQSKGGKAQKIIGAAINSITLLLGLIRLAYIVFSRRIEIIHSTDRPRDALVSTLLARITGRKNILHLHIKWDTHMGRATTWAVEHCDAVLAISQFVRQSLLDGGVPDSKIYTALNASDPVEFDPDKVAAGSFRKQIGLKEETPLIGIVARVMFWKGHHTLVEAFAEVRKTIPDAVLAIIGKELGGFALEVRTRIKELGLEDSVHWAGWFDESAPIFADLDVVCVPSWEEPFGLVVTEALAMRRAVVGYASGALPEIISDGKEGVLVPPGDIPALAEAIRALLKDPQRRREYGYAGRERVLRQFTPARQAHEVADIYRQICRPAAVSAERSSSNAA